MWSALWHVSGFLFVNFLDRLCSLSALWTHHVSKTGLDLVIILPLSPKHWDHPGFIRCWWAKCPLAGEWKKSGQAQHRRPHHVQTSDTQQLLFKISAFCNYRVHVATFSLMNPRRWVHLVKRPRSRDRMFQELPLDPSRNFVSTFFLTSNSTVEFCLIESVTVI